ncbi:MAG: translation initiation factor IF-2 N-terminal domain-containing protein, partial [Mariprofundaceae bacterium]|nr:translation initiation factor IF-2 N-terminal domain-containing protein [Mariprofundaceae bacterium]
MANKRVLELAKELNVEVADVKRAASSCGVAVTGPTTMLNDEDTGKIKANLKEPAKSGSGGKTLTLSRPVVTGQQERSSSVEGRGRTVQVAVRRRRAAPKPADSVAKSTAASDGKLSLKKESVAAPEKVEVNTEAKQAVEVKKTPEVKKPAAKEKPVVTKQKSPAKTEPKITKKPAVKKLSPAQMAAQAVEKNKEQAKVREQEARAKRAEARTSSRPNPNRSTRPGERPNPNRSTRPGERPNPNRSTRPSERPNPNRSTRPGVRPNPNRPAAGGAGQQKRPASGPRTTIRTGLTPAQIAASKAPKSSLKQIEAKITKERNDRRRENNANRGGARPNRPAGANTGAGITRRPSVAVTTDPNAPTAPAGIKRRGPGGPQRQQQRRLSPAEKAARRSYSSKRHEVLTPQQEERMARLAKGGRRRGANIITKDDEAFVIREVEVTNPIVVSELASRMATKTTEVLKKLMEMGSIVAINDNIDADTAILLVEEFGHKAKLINEAAVEDVLAEVIDEDDEGLLPRPPVVVVMGHVDHGKTSILDALRKAHIADGEAGGITQHIGAYMVKLDGGERVVFVDTPGHEAFTSLRARGAKLTDVAVLVVAADDGVMPQTVEALSHAKSAGVPIIVAINKMDKEGANPENVKRQLSEHEIIPEDWGGDTIFVEVSAHTGQGLEDLLEMLALQTEVLELKANPEGVGRGVVVESRLDKGRGPVATVLVQNGT